MTDIKLHRETSSTINFHNGNADPIVILRPDGTIEVNEKFSTTEAAKAFWEALKLVHYQNYLEQQIIEKVLLSHPIHMLMGTDDWDLNTDEELVLKKIIKDIQTRKP